MGDLALTIDLEFLENNSGMNSTASIEKEAIRELVDKFEENDQQITFFTVAQIVEQHRPFLIEILDSGHEIASHSYNHSLLTEISEKEIRREVIDSKKLLEEKLGIEIKGFRAPALKYNNFVLKEIEEAGYEYDSSMFEGSWFYSGKEDTGEFNFVEKPVSGSPRLGVPISGFFLRLFGKNFVIKSINEIQRRGKTPVIYVHPYEISNFASNVSWRHSFRTGSYVADFIEELTEQNNLVRMKDI